MKLDEVLAMAGEHQLSGFDWGISAVALFNTLVTQENHIDVSHTGKQAFDKLRRLPSATLTQVLVHEVQVEGTLVKFIGTAREQARGVPPTVPQAQKKMNPMALFLMIVMTVICLSLAFSSIFLAHKGGDPSQQTKALQVILSTMVELTKEENKQPAPAHPPPQEPSEEHMPP